jgi:GNAT superfamily N-acetyltransferase
MQSIKTNQPTSMHRLQQDWPVPSIRLARRTDLPAIVELHTIALPDFFLANPGIAFLRAFYSLVLRDRHGLLIVSEHNNCFGGFVAALTNWETFRQRLAMGRLRLLPTVAASLARHPMQTPGLMTDLCRAARYTRNCCFSSDAACDLVAIAVEPRCRMQGHGTALLRALVAAARRQAMPQVRVRFNSKDVGMHSFYRKRGFVPLCVPASSDGRRLIEYALSLQNNSGDSHVNSQS